MEFKSFQKYKTSRINLRSANESTGRGFKCPLFKGSFEVCEILNMGG